MHLVSIAGATMTGLSFYESFDPELVRMLNQRNIRSIAELQCFLGISAQQAEQLIQPRWVQWALVSEARYYFLCIDKLGLDFKWLDKKIEKVSR